MDYFFFQFTNDNNRLAVTNNIEVIFAGSKRCESGPSSRSDNNKFDVDQYSNQFNSCRTLQRKLELKVECVKKKFNQNSENEAFYVVSLVVSIYAYNTIIIITVIFIILSNAFSQTKSNNTFLMPINRLPIPGHKENVTLVEYKSVER